MIPLHLATTEAVTLIMAALVTISVSVASATAIYVVRQLRPGNKTWRE